MDIKELTTDDIVEINGEKWILSKRHKTKVNFQVKLLDIPLQIIKRYALKYVNYDLHSPSTINFTIPESAMEAWQDDYADMRRFFIYGKSLEFGALVLKMRELQGRVRVM